ncbi:S-adenosyl-L-methionine-dependent methyltransferase [Lindgomyces ingoldianus]|uniref:S-adenosyl-L-methionine-dependent methyltransferase n=1 Tax=Lindgomyces ingoldianus TaxID=673940 RepID=A0ACB6QGC9_9PLEO|nr:S-adenosyl-L-methionine-dependent methyltransferase [Lindgomyces ingoldianus]KAF2466038.1 S-adenosyl-L-methionine-dependent methyltransferase [Lindgomyces ingoldianus]
MTQPTSINMTFDTSLIDLCQGRSTALNSSFSTTESEPSDAGQPLPTEPTMKTPTLPQGPPTTSQPECQSQDTPKQSQTLDSIQSSIPTLPPPPKCSTPIQHLPTQEAYNAWSSVYDADGNMLQAIDDLELLTLLPDFLSLVLASHSPESRLHIIDLGCGTGRNTAKMLGYAWPKEEDVHITGLDFSQGMLDVAARKLGSIHTGNPGPTRVTWSLEQCDCFPTVNTPNLPTPSSTTALPTTQTPLPLAIAVISTLVLEHIPLSAYFSTLAALVRKGGYALITNMHDEMGRISQAGFVREDGVKIRGTSFAHGVDETVEEAQRMGFEVVVVKERGVEAEDVESGVVGVKVWYGLVVRKAE